MVSKYGFVNKAGLLMVGILNMFNKVKVSVILGMAFACVIFVGIFVTTFAGFKLSVASDQGHLTGARLNDLQSLQKLKDNVTKQTTLLLNLAIVDKTNSTEEIADEFRTLQKNTNFITKHFRGLIEGAKSIPGINLQEVDRASDLLRKIENTSAAYVSGADKTFRSSDTTLHQNLRQLIPAFMEYHQSIDDMVSYQATVTLGTAENSALSLSGVYTTLTVLTVVFTIIGFTLSWLITRHLKRQLGGEPAQAQALAAAIASGNLLSVVTLRRNDTSSLLASLVEMQTTLRNLVSDIKQSASSVALAADEISQGNTELSSRTEQQAAALQETAASMEQLTATVKSNSEGAKQTAVSARGASKLAQSGESDVQTMSETMLEISSSAGRVRDITQVIESIAFQTNILALNAAVEAARAGEEGRGFAVVAGEVRTLAQRSATAARDIKELIEHAVYQVEKGVNVAEGTGQNILRIIRMVNELANSMDEISLASSEQMQGISQVNLAVSQMDGVTQNNAVLVEESSSASQALLAQAHALRDFVEKFRV